LAHTRYCPGQRTVGASNSSGAAVQFVLLPPGDDSLKGAKQRHFGRDFQDYEIFGRASRGLTWRPTGKLSEAHRARWPQPKRLCANGAAFRWCTDRSPTLWRGCGLRALGAEFLPAAQVSPRPSRLVSSGGIGRKPFGSRDAVVRKRPSTSLPKHFHRFCRGRPPDTVIAAAATRQLQAQTSPNRV